MRPCGRSVRGLTLLEVVISIGLIALLLSFLLGFFWQTLEIRDRAAAMANRTQVVEQMLGKIAAELKQALGLEQITLPGFVQFEGDRRRISFLTAALPDPDTYDFFGETDDRPLPKVDLRQVTYELWIDPDDETEDGDPIVGGILRTEQQVLNPYETEETVPEGEDLLYLRRDLWSYELGYLEFRYFDGAQWSTTWRVSEGNRLPHLVQITIGFDSLTREQLEDQDLNEFPIDQYPLGADRPDPLRYSRIVRLPAADEMYSARLHRLADEVEEVYESGVPEGGETEGEGL